MGKLAISTEVFDYLADRIRPLDTEARRARYLNGDFPRADRVNDLWCRYRWDLLNEAVGAQYIDSALRRIVPPIEQAVTA